MEQKTKNKNTLNDVKKQIISIVVAGIIFGFVSMYTSVITVTSKLDSIEKRLTKIENLFDKNFFLSKQNK